MLSYNNFYYYAEVIFERFLGYTVLSRFLRPPVIKTKLKNTSLHLLACKELNSPFYTQI